MLAFIHINEFHSNEFHLRKHEKSRTASKLARCIFFGFQHNLKASLNGNPVVAVCLYIAYYLRLYVLCAWHLISPGDFFRVAYSNSPVSSCRMLIQDKRNM